MFNDVTEAVKWREKAQDRTGELCYHGHPLLNFVLCVEEITLDTLYVAPSTARNYISSFQRGRFASPFHAPPYGRPASQLFDRPPYVPL